MFFAYLARSMGRLLTLNGDAGLTSVKMDARDIVYDQ